MTVEGRPPGVIDDLVPYVTLPSARPTEGKLQSRPDPPRGHEWRSSEWVEGPPVDRTVETIARDLRACERELEAVLDEVALAEVLARLETLREEHRIALAAREARAHDLAKRIF